MAKERLIDLDWTKLTDEFMVKVEPKEIVALLIVDHQDRILLVQENHCDKNHGRENGQWNIVTETCEQQDGFFFDTACAGLIEEVTGGIAEFKFVAGTYNVQTLPLNDGKGFYIRHGVIVLCCQPELINKFSPIDSSEIAGYQWVDYDQLVLMADAGKVESDVLTFIQEYKDKGLL